MDDPNNDGKVNRKDAAYLYDFIDTMSRKGNWPYLGGLGEYGTTSAHGPFVHVDARGYRSRCGRNPN